MTIKKSTFAPVLLAAAFLSGIIVTGCNNDAEKTAPATEEKKTEAAPSTTTPPDTANKQQMDTATTRPTKPGS